jgi:hypothetical protein
MIDREQEWEIDVLFEDEQYGLPSLLKKSFSVLVTYNNKTQRQIVVEAIDAREAGQIAWQTCDGPSNRVVATQVL